MEQIFPLLSPLLIGGIAGITVTCAVFPKVIINATRLSNTLNKEIQKRNSELNRNEGWKEIKENLETFIVTTLNNIDTYENAVIVFFTLSFLFLLYPLYNAIFIDAVNVSIEVKVLIALSYACILIAIGLIILTYQKMIDLRTTSVLKTFKTIEEILAARKKRFLNS